MATASSLISRIEERLAIYGPTIGHKLKLGRDGRGYFITYDGVRMHLTDGRTLDELAAYVDGMRDMILIRQNRLF